MKKGLIQVERLHKSAIRNGDITATDAIARFHMLAVGMMAEARLRTIIWDPTGFNERERRLLIRARSQLDRWQAAVEYAFRRHYSVPIHQDLDRFVLGTNPFLQYQTVIDLLDSHLSVVIDDRNKTAHAQWAWHLNNEETSFIQLRPRPSITERSRLAPT